MPADDALSAIERELGLILRRARRLSAAAAHEVHPDLEAPGYTLLLWLHSSGAARITDLANAFGVGKATMSRQVRMLEQLDLLRRNPDPQDGRAQVLRLTPDATTRMEALREVRHQRFQALFATWTEGEVADLAVTLTRFNQLVGDRLER